MHVYCKKREDGVGLLNADDAREAGLGVASPVSLTAVSGMGAPSVITPSPLSSLRRLATVTLGVTGRAYIASTITTPSSASIASAYSDRMGVAVVSRS